MTFSGITMLKSAIIQTNGFGNSACNVNFLTDAVNKVEPAVRPHYRQWNTWEPAATPEVNKLSAAYRSDKLGNYQRVQDMVRV